MAVFSNQVKEGLINYFNALLSYPISKERAKEKFTNLVNALNGLDNGIVKIRCKWKDLGQKYDKNGRMLIPDLYQYVWKDEADRPWSFSYVLDTNGIAHILIMKYSHFVKENNQNKTYKEMSRIRLTESQLHNVIKRCINESLEDKMGYYVGSLEGEKAEILYDKFSHYECGIEFAINYVAHHGDCSWDYSESDIETIPNGQNYKVWEYRGCILGYDQFTGIFDIYDLEFDGKA